MKNYNNSKLTIVIPVYKVEPYIRKCLDSIVNQTYKNLEIIIVDDGSPDNCGSICDEYAQKDERIVVIHKKNEGLTRARNEGLDRASGEWITFVDSDDWCDIDYYENFFEEIGGSKPDIFIAGGHYAEYDDHQEEKSNEISEEKKGLRGKKRNDYLMAKILSPKCGDKRLRMATSIGMPWDKLYRTDFLKKNNIFFDPVCKAWEDLLFNFEAFDKADNISLGKCKGYHYRMVNSSITKGYNSNKLNANYYFIEKVYQYMEKREKDDLIQSAIYARGINLFANMLRAQLLNDNYPVSKKERKKQFKEAKEMKYFYEAIYTSDTRCFTTRQKVFQILVKWNLVSLIKRVI